MEYPQILKQIQQRQFAPVYYLHGEESYFIDKLVEALDADGAVLSAAETAFNREVLYGPEANANQVLTACRSFPVMAERRLVVLKEAHRMPKNELDKLASYVQQPVPSTVLVVAFKDRKAGLPKAAVTAISQHGVDFHAKRLYDKDIQRWTEVLLQESGVAYDKEIPLILLTNLGTNLPLIENELEKILLYLKATKQERLSKELVYEMINVDKEFNAFELVAALSKREAYRAHLIVDQLTQNTKLNPPVLVISTLFRFFDQVARVHRFQLRDPNSVRNQLKVNYFQALDYLEGAKRYSLGHTYRNIGFIQDADLQLKGQIPSHMDDRHLLKTLVWRLLN